MPTDLVPASSSSRAPVPAGRKPDLRGKKKDFSDTFLLDHSMIDAAKAAKAPFGKERAFANKMMSDPKVATYITMSIAETETALRPTQLRVLDEMNAIAFNDPGAMFEFYPEGGENAGELKRLRFDRIDKRAVAEFTLHQGKDKDGNNKSDLRVKFAPKVDILKTLAQTNGLLADDGAPPARVSIIIGENIQINSGGVVQ